jgi:esterase/lipase
MQKNGMKRRAFLQRMGLGLAAGTVMVGLDALPALAGEGDEHGMRGLQSGDQQPWYTLGLFEDPLMDERMLFYLGHVWYRMADIGEVLDTATRIEDGNPSSWRTEWYRTADRVKAMADDSLSRGHNISAGEAYLRACSYYLAGLIYSEGPDDFDLARAARASAETFESALPLLGIPGEPVQIPYENAYLPGYFFRSDVADGDAPILIVHQGMDASVEEALFLATESIRRGYHALLFHHPGQGLALRELGLTFRPDWENVITPVVDFAIAQPGVDAERIMLTGLSFGGSLITRAVAFEKRVKIAIPNPAHYDWWAFISNYMFGETPEFADLLENNPAMFDGAMALYLEQAPPMWRWWFKAAMWKFGGETPSETLNNLKGFTNADIVDQVTCQVLVMAGEGENWGADYGEMLYEALTTEKDIIRFTAEDTALLHNQNGAISVSVHRMFDWLDEHI